VSGIQKVGVVVHPGRPPAVELGKLLAEWAGEHGIELRTLVSERGCIGEDVPCVEPEDFAPGLNLVVAVGGDGTLLRALGMVLTEQVPALGVNAGRLGFLAEVEPHDLGAALDAVWAGRYRVERRTTLEARVLVDGRQIAEDLAVNDVVLEKAARERLAAVAVSLGDGGGPFARYAADGVMVASPTGSTAYSFSAGGPIVSPRLDALLLTPIAPHMVFNRSLVLHPDEAVHMEVLPDNPVIESVDGRPARELPPGAVVEVRRGRYDALLVRIGRADFYRLVRSKFRLADPAATDATA
jgi:NAD+ kinase